MAHSKCAVTLAKCWGNNSLFVSIVVIFNQVNRFVFIILENGLQISLFLSNLNKFKIFFTMKIFEEAGIVLKSVMEIIAFC